MPQQDASSTEVNEGQGQGGARSNQGRKENQMRRKNNLTSEGAKKSPCIPPKSDLEVVEREKNSVTFPLLTPK